jgi:hypothetical protein
MAIFLDRRFGEAALYLIRFSSRLGTSRTAGEEQEMAAVLYGLSAEA